MTPEQQAAELTAFLRTPSGTMQLRDIQGVAILTADAAPPPGGLFTNLSVGLGKSLLIAVLMHLFGGKRPMVMTEASSVPQLNTDFERYRLHWKMPTYYRLEAYDKLSSKKHANMLEEMRPTALFLDEAHKVKFEKPRWRRIERWRELCPDAPMFCLSGSPGRDFGNYAHLILWAVPSLGSNRGGPIPVDDTGKPRGAEFKAFCKRLDEDEQFHDEFWEQLRAHPGVLISAATYTATPLTITHTVLPTPPEMIPHWERLRQHGEAPDGWVLESGPGEQWLMARCFANNMYYEHEPRPPKPYQEARKAWFGMCRTIIEDEHFPGGPYDTPGQVVDAVLAGKLPRELYDRWMAVKDTYKPTTKTTWLSRASLEYAAQWGAERAKLATRTSGGSIIWVEQTGTGVELSRMTGWPFYSDGAKNARRQHVSLADKPGTPPVIICSVKSCGTGKNLQHRFSRALYMNPPSNNDQAEQWFGRIHRDGQLEKMVEIELLYGCLEDWCGWMKAESLAAAAEKDLTAPRKILLARHLRSDYPDVEEAGPAWKRVSRVVVEIPE